MTAAQNASWISSGDTFAILAVFFGLTALASWLERTTIGQRISSAMLVIAFSLMLANLGILPRTAPAYDAIWTCLVPLAIALYLIRADLVGIVRHAGRTLLAFAIGAIGVCVGAWLGAQLLDLGPREAQYAAVFTGTYIGGSLNFAAVA